jgi:hypothetical protein
MGRPAGQRNSDRPTRTLRLSPRTLRAREIRSSRDQRRRATERELQIPGSDDAHRACGCCRYGRRLPNVSRSLDRRETSWQPLRVSGAGHGSPRDVPFFWCTVFLWDTVLLNAFGGPTKMSTRVVWSRLPLAHVSCVADKKVGVVVTNRSPYVTKSGYKSCTMGYESPDDRCVSLLIRADHVSPSPVRGSLQLRLLARLAHP